MELVYLIIGICIGALLAWLYFRPKLNGANNLDLVKLEERLKNANTKIEETSGELSNEREKLALANNRLAKAEEAFSNMNEKLKTQKQEMEDLQEKFTKEFELIANRLLDEKSKKFTEQNKEGLDAILKPLGEKIKDFEKKVDETNKDSIARNSALQQQIIGLKDLNEQMSKDAINLTKALKGESKTQGNWGEVVLEKILERSGLIRDQEYKTQVSSTTEEGRRVQPDVVIMLPDDKHIIIDSKVSLTAYEAFINSEDENQKLIQLKSHVDSVRGHIKDLSSKNYQGLGDMNTPDFVLLFMPIEPSFSLAIQSDHELFNFAWDRKIVMVSPTTLLATLRTIASIWKQERQNRNAMEIAKQSGQLYDKFVGFVEDLLRIGKNIKDTQKAYDDSINKLAEGKGNLIRRVERIKELGANNTKEIPTELINKDNIIEE